VNGVPQEVVIDDYIPCDADLNYPCFASSKVYGEVWMCLLEKAWAKLHKSYCMTRHGLLSSVF
jgi:hypothetical protein